MPLLSRRFQLGALPQSTVRGALLGARLAAVIASVAVLSALGLWDVVDSLLERQYYAVRGTRASHQSVVLVGIDDETISRWGAPPYSWDRLAPVYAKIAAGKPAVTAVVEPGLRLLRGDPPPPAIAAAVYARRLLVPAPAGGSPAPALAVSTSGAIDAVLLRDAHGATLTAEILERSGLRARNEDRLPVNFIGRDSLPQVSALRVAADGIPAGTFAGKIVLIGIVAPSAGGEVMTPVGALPPAAVYAHALLGVTDGVAWRRTSGWARWLLLVLIALAVLILLPQVDERRALAGAIAAALLFLFADYVLFARGIVRWGASSAVFTVIASVIAAGFVERRRLRVALGDIGRELRLRAGTDALGDARSDEQAFWLRVAELARLYLECRSSIVAELPPDRWHLSLRVITGASLDQIQEKRRDIRRGPYRRAHLTLNPVWQDDFMSAQRGEKTLLVPLVVSTRLYGFWILNFPVEAHLEPPQIKLVSALARQISLAVEKRQRRGTRVIEGPLLERLLGDGRLGVELDALGAEIKRLAGDNRALGNLVDNLPFGVVVGTLWGEVRYVNAAMRRLAAEEGEERVQGLSVPEIVMAMTDLGKDEVYDGMRRLVRELPELHLSGRPDSGTRRARVHLVLSWLAREEPRADGDEGEQLLLLCAVPTRLASRARARASDFQDESTTQMRLAGGQPPEPSEPGTPPPPDDSQPGNGATERMPLESMERLMADLPQPDAEALRGVVDALRTASGDDTTTHVKLQEPPSRRST